MFVPGFVVISPSEKVLVGGYCHCDANYDVMERISPLHDIMECIYVYDMSMMHPFHVIVKIRQNGHRRWGWLEV